MTYWVVQGIGFGFVKKYLARPNTTVVATVRNPDSAEAQSIHDIPKADGSKVILVKLESSSDTDALDAVKSLKAEGITHLDVVIANAGIFKVEAFVPVSEMKISDLLQHVDINAGGPVRLYQATLPLLKAAKQPKFSVISTVGASIGLVEELPFPVTSYGASKAAVNLLLRRIHVENTDLIAIAFHPGYVTASQKILLVF